MALARLMRIPGVTTTRPRLSPEAVLVARAQRGDAGAFETLVRRHKDSVLNLARRMIADRDAAEDIAQEAFIKAYRELYRFRGESAFATWLYRIAVNEARQYLRGQQRRVARWERQRDLAAAEPPAEPRTDDPAPLTELLHALSEDQREALALFYLRELSLEEIARAGTLAPTRQGEGSGVNCERVQMRLAEYSAGLIQGPERLRLSEHLAACAACRAELDEYRALDELLAGEAVSADERLVHKVMTDVRVMGAPQRPAWLLALEQMAPLAAVAAGLPVLALFVVTVLSWSSSPAAEALFAGVPYNHGIPLGVATGICGLAALFTAWLTWRAAEAVS